MFVDCIWLEGRYANLILLEISSCGPSTCSGYSEKLGLESPSVEEMPLPPSLADININHY